jgi:3'(2'), 5'-bisphosphate nucleotidase
MKLDDTARDDIALRLGEIAREAGRLLQALEALDGDHRLKADGSPTTAADAAAEAMIIARLREAWPDIPVVAEESVTDSDPGDLFFLVDPLDGTRDFLRGTGEYSVNIALVAGDRPVAAAVAAPVMKRIWIAGSGAREGAVPSLSDEPLAWSAIHVRRAPADDVVALVSRRHGDDATDACLAALSIGTRRAASSALKFCLIASGEADVYVRCGPTMEWDTAAGDHILTQAGGRVIRSGGGTMVYGRYQEGYLNGPFAAVGDPALAPLLNLPAAA